MDTEALLPIDHSGIAHGSQVSCTTHAPPPGHGPEFGAADSHAMLRSNGRSPEQGAVNTTFPFPLQVWSEELQLGAVPQIGELSSVTFMIVEPQLSQPATMESVAWQVQSSAIVADEAGAGGLDATVLGLEADAEAPIKVAKANIVASQVRDLILMVALPA